MNTNLNKKASGLIYHKVLLDITKSSFQFEPKLNNSSDSNNESMTERKEADELKGRKPKVLDILFQELFGIVQ